MSSPQNSIITRFGWELDAASQKRVLKALADFRKATEAGLDDKAVDKFGKRFGKLAREIGLPADAVDKLTNELLAMGGNLDQIEKFGAAFLDVSRNAERAGKEVKELSKIQLRQQRFDEVSRNVGLAGDIQSNLGALNALSGGQFGAAGEVVALVEELPRLKTAIAGLPQTLSSAASAIGPQGLIIGAALAAVAVGISDLVSRAQSESQALQDAFQREADVSKRIADGLTTEEIQAELENAQTAYNEALNQLAKANEDAAQQFQAVQDDIPALGVFADGVARAVFTISDAANSGSVDAAIENQRKAQQAVDESWNAIKVLNSALNDGRLATNDAAVAEKELATLRDEQSRLTAELAQVEKQTASITEQYNRQSSRTNAARRLAATRDEEDFNDRIADIRQAGQARIEAIEKAGQARIAAISNDLDGLPGKLAAELADAEKQAVDKRKAILNDFAADANRDYEKFVLKENQIRRKANIDQLRLEQDFRDRLNDAASEGDVEAFLRAQREREKALTRQAEDVDTEAQTRAENFSQEQEQRRQDLQKRLDELRVSLEQERAEIRNSYELRRAELAEQLEAEQKALEDAVTTATNQITEQENALAAERKKRLDRQREDERRADTERRLQYENELRQIGERRRAVLLEVAATNSLIRAAQSLQAATSAIQSASAGGSTRSGTSRAATRTPRNIPIGLATGGLAIAQPGGVAAILAERGENELAIPVGNATGQGAYVEAISRLHGALGGRGGGGGVVINLADHRSFNVGDVASVSMVEQALVETTDVWTQDIIKGIETARYKAGAA